MSESLDNLLDHIQASIYAVHPNDDALHMSLRFIGGHLERVLGYGPQEFVENPDLWSSLIHSDDVDDVKHQTREMIEARHVVTRTYRIRHKTGGDYVLWEDRLTPLFNATGEYDGYIGIGFDITTRKKSGQVSIPYLQKIADQAPGALYEFQIAPDGTQSFPFISESIADIHPGMTAQMLQNDASLGFSTIHPDDVEEIRESIEGSYHTLTNLDVEFRVVADDGSIRWHRANARPERLEDGTVTWYGIFQDITERKQIQDSIRQQTERLEQSERYAGLGSWEYDVVSGRGWWSAQMYKLLGFKDSTEVPDIEKYLAHIHPEDRPIVRDVLMKMSRGEEPLSQEFRSNPEYGGSRHFAPTVTLIRDEKGEPVRLVGTLHDITDRKKAEEALRESETRFRSLFDSSPDAILVSDGSGKIVLVNRQATSLFNCTSSEMVGKVIENFIPDRFKNHQLLRQDYISEPKVRPMGTGMQLFAKRKDGTEFPVEIALAPIGVGTDLNVIATIRDITDKKNLEQQFLRSQRIENIGFLAGGVAHDINNVLAPILMSAELLELTTIDERSQRMLATIKTSARRGSELVKQVLSFARGTDDTRALVQVRHLIDEIKSIIKQTFPKSISVHTDVPNDLPTVYADPTQLHQVLMNLCVNARDAMPEGGKLEIRAEGVVVDEQYARMHTVADPGHYVVIIVTDQGTGMSPDSMKHIFDPFFTTKDLDKGTGLGLSTVHSIVKSHQGFIDVKSEVGKGATFRVYVPAREGLPKDVSKEEEEEVLPGGTGELILVVDDESAVREITKSTLEVYGYSVITASDGTEAVAAFVAHAKSIALTLTDMVMPFMDGTATIRAIRKLDPKAKIIAVSGVEQHTEEFKDQNVVFLKKPYSAADLLTTIDKNLRG